MESRENFRQSSHARITQSPLQAIASEIDMYPNGLETINNVGMKMNATTSKATVMV